MVSLMWFKQDLRTDDNPALHAAMQHAECVPVYCLDPRWFVPDSRGLVRCGARRAQFLLESLVDLKRSLRLAGSDLLVLSGEPEQLLPALCAALGVGVIHTHEEHAPDEQALLARLGRSLPEHVELKAEAGNGLFDPAQLPFALEQLPAVFTRFRNKIEKQPPAHLPLGRPAAFAPLPAAALEHVQAIPSLQDLGLEVVAVEPVAARRPAGPGWTTICGAAGRYAITRTPGTSCWAATFRRNSRPGWPMAVCPHGGLSRNCAPTSRAMGPTILPTGCGSNCYGGSSFA